MGMTVEQKIEVIRARDAERPVEMITRPPTVETLWRQMEPGVDFNFNAFDYRVEETEHEAVVRLAGASRPSLTDFVRAGIQWGREHPK